VLRTSLAIIVGPLDALNRPTSVIVALAPEVKVLVLWSVSLETVVVVTVTVAAARARPLAADSVTSAVCVLAKAVEPVPKAM
jgi:hypothetical protein